MTETSAVQCPRCKKHLRQTAHLPAEGQLPAVSGYWCEDCKIEHTVEED